MADTWLWRDICKGEDDQRQEPVFKLDLKSGVETKEHQEVKNSRVIASFCTSGLESGTAPVMLIPGCPRRYVRWQGGQMKQQRDEMIIDENHLINPRYPLETLIRAVEICQGEKFDWQSVDLVTDRNSFRKMFSTLSSGLGDDRSEPFRIDIERVGQTVMLTRVERVDKEMSAFPTFAKFFDTVSAKPVNRQFDASFRCISEMEFGWLRVVIRFEVDCVDFGSKDPILPNNGSDSLEELLENLSLSSKGNGGERFSDDSELRYKQVPQFDPGYAGNKKLPVEGATLVELATRAIHRGFPGEKWLQMYVSGTGKLALARHQRGRVRKVEELTLQEVESQLPGGTRPHEALDKLAIILKKLVDFVREQPNGSLFSAIWEAQFEDSRESLRIYRREDDATTRVAPKLLLEKISK